MEDSGLWSTLTREASSGTFGIALRSGSPIRRCEVCERYLVDPGTCVHALESRRELCERRNDIGLCGVRPNASDDTHHQ